MCKMRQNLGCGMKEIVTVMLGSYTAMMCWREWGHQWAQTEDFEKLALIQNFGEGLNFQKEGEEESVMMQITCLEAFFHWTLGLYEVKAFASLVTRHELQAWLNVWHIVATQKYLLNNKVQDARKIMKGNTLLEPEGSK